MTAIKANTPTSPTEFPNSPGYCSKFIAWCRKNPKKAAGVLIIVIAIVYIWIHGPFQKIHNVYGEPASLGHHGSGVN